MLIDITKIKVFRASFDIVIGEFINPITNELQSVSLGVYKLGEKQDFFTTNLAEIINHSNRSNNESFNSNYREQDYEEYEEYAEYDYSEY